jgi:hypothetical protein
MRESTKRIIAIIGLALWLAALGAGCVPPPSNVVVVRILDVTEAEVAAGNAQEWRKGVETGSPIVGAVLTGGSLGDATPIVAIVKAAQVLIELIRGVGTKNGKVIEVTVPVTPGQSVTTTYEAGRKTTVTVGAAAPEGEQP